MHGSWLGDLDLRHGSSLSSKVSGLIEGLIPRFTWRVGMVVASSHLRFILHRWVQLVVLPWGGRSSPPNKKHQ